MSAVMTAPESEVGNRPAEGLITDEAVAAARAMIGLHLRPEGPYLQDATADTLRNWCNGIGDLNPLYRDVGYGAATRYGSISATRCSRWPSAGSAARAGACPACTASTPATTGSCSATCARATASPRSSASSAWRKRRASSPAAWCCSTWRLATTTSAASWLPRPGHLHAPRAQGGARHRQVQGDRAVPILERGARPHRPDRARRAQEHPRRQCPLLGRSRDRRGAADHRARPAFADGHDGLPGWLRPRPHARRGAAGGGEAPGPLLPQSGSGRRRGVHRHRPPPRVGCQGSRRARHV